MALLFLRACIVIFSFGIWQGHAFAAGPVAPPSSTGLKFSLQFSTYFGGTSGELLRDMTVDTQGNIYIAGSSGSTDLPTTPGDLPGTSKKDGAFVAKFSADGKLVWSKHCGSDKSYFYSVKVDKDGSVFVAGRMMPGFPTTPGAFQPVAKHPCGFVGKLKPDASAWVWASYVGTGYAARDMTIDDKGDIYCVLDYFSESTEVLPAEWFVSAFSKTPHGGGNHFGRSDAGIIKVSNDGKVVWATWIGGTKGNDWVASLGVGADHAPVILMRTWSKDMPVTAGAAGPAEASATPMGEGWLSKLSADGAKLVFGTYIADAFPRTHNLALDSQGNIFICTCTKNWPVTAGAFQTKYGGGPEDFGIAKFSPAGKLLASTYLGGNGHETNGPDQMVVDAKGNVVVAGSTSATDFPVTPGALQPKNADAGGKYPYDGIASVLSNDLSTLLYSTYIGGTGDDMARACCVGSDGTLYIGGVTTSRDFPVKNAFQEKYGGDPGYGSTPNGGQFPVGWGNGDCWIEKLHPLSAASTTTQNAPQTPPTKATPRIQILRDIEYAKIGDKSLLLDIYKPAAPAGKLPLVMWIHGGAWRGGSKNFCPQLHLTERGYIVASIDYRLSQEAIFPAQIEDCKAAIRFLRANAAKYSIDADRIGVAGDSAGGHLVALLGTSNGVKEAEGKVGNNLATSSTVQCVVDFYGPTDLLKFKGQPVWPKIDDPKSPLCQLVGGPLMEKQELVAKANPITYVSKSAPPFLIIHGNSDNTVPFNQSELLVAALKQAGADVTFEIVKNGGHGFNAEQSQRLKPIVEAFFDKHLKSPSAK